MIDSGILRKLNLRLPYGVLFSLLPIVFIGVVNLSSAARATRPDLYINHFTKFGFAFLLLVCTALVHTRVIKRLSLLTFSAVIFLLLLVLVVGTTIKGSQRWLVFGAFRLQPSDPAKIALVLALAQYCATNWPQKGYSLLMLLRPLNITRPLGFLGAVVLMLVKARHGSQILSSDLLKSGLGSSLMIALLVVGLGWLFLSILKMRHDGISLENMIAPIDVLIVPFLLVYAEPDLGTSLIIFAIGAIMFLYVGVRRSSLIFSIVAGGGFSVFAYFTLLKDYQKQRLITFFNPKADVYGDGYQSMQSIIAIGSGGASGKGFNGGTQTQLSFLPENSTDFVFSVWAEEWGFVACVFLLGLYFALLWSILRIAGRMEDKFSQLVCIGVAANIFLHVLINIGMVTGLMPVVGVPLPFMSYGGSVMSTMMIGIGLVVNVSLWRGAK